MRQTYFIF